jgi:hypothetical protein
MTLTKIYNKKLQTEIAYDFLTCKNVNFFVENAIFHNIISNG